MTEAKHTPGPWHAERIRLDGHEWFIKSECRNLPPYNWLARMNIKIDPLTPLNGNYVNSTGGFGANSSDAGCCPLAISENAANAHLIAAAPDMLAALQAVLRVADRQTVEFDLARAALAKAALA